MLDMNSYSAYTRAMANKVIGIDLGTTNSVVAVMEGGQPAVIVIQEGSRITPSVVAITEEGERLVGQVAKRQAVTNPENTIFSIKRFMGRKYDEVSSEASRVPYKVVRAQNGDAWIEARGKKYSPPEISAMVLQKLKQAAEDHLGETITDAVLTVPAYFNDAQRQATKDAGKIAGLNVLRIINEPTAASLAYGLDKKKNETIMVFDLGGGTFDVSVLDVGEGVFEVRSTSGDTHLGGDDFDKRLVDWMAEAFLHDQGIDLRKNVQALVRRLTGGKEPNQSVNPDEVVAVGAAIQAGVLAGEVKDVVLLDVTPLSLGVETLGGIMTKLIERNTTIPVRKSEVFSTAEENQAAVDIHVLQGERELARENRTLGHFRLEGIRTAPRGVPQIEVTFDIDANGILTVAAKDKASGKEQKITITGSTQLSKEEIDRMVRDGQAHSEEDRRRREEVEARNSVDSIAYQVERQIRDLGDGVPLNEKARAEQLIAEIRELVKSNSSDIGRLRQLASDLQQIAHALASTAYSRAASAGAQGGGTGNARSG